MIAPIGLSADAILESCDLSGTRQTDLHRELAGIILSHGQLVFANDSAEAYFHNQVLTLSKSNPSAGKYWEGLLQYGRLARAEEAIGLPIEHIEDMSALVKAWHGAIELALMEPTRAAIVGCPETHGAWVDPRSGLEVGRHDCAGGTATLGTLRALDSQRSVPTGTDRDVLWEQRIAPLIRASQRIHVQDAYLGANLDQHYKWCTGARSPHRDEHEVEWMFRRIAQDAHDAVLSIYSRCPSTWDPQVIITAFLRAATRLHGTGVTRAQLFGLPPLSWTLAGLRFQVSSGCC